MNAGFGIACSSYFLSIIWEGSVVFMSFTVYFYVCLRPGGDFIKDGRLFFFCFFFFVVFFFFFFFLLLFFFFFVLFFFLFFLLFFCFFCLD